MIDEFCTSPLFKWNKEYKESQETAQDLLVIAGVGRYQLQRKQMSCKVLIFAKTISNPPIPQTKDSFCFHHWPPAGRLAEAGQNEQSTGLKTDWTLSMVSRAKRMSTGFTGNVCTVSPEGQWALSGWWFGQLTCESCFVFSAQIGFKGKISFKKTKPCYVQAYLLQIKDDI